MVKMTLSLKSCWPDCGSPSQYELKAYVVCEIWTPSHEPLLPCDSECGCEVSLHADPWARLTLPVLIMEARF